MSTTTVSDTHESAKDEYLRLQVEKVVADVRLDMATEKRKEEASKRAADAEKAEEDKQLKASEAFSKAYHGWLAAKAGIQDPLAPEEEQPARYRADGEAERHLFTTPAVHTDQFWSKLTAFEQILGDELMSGLRKDSVLLLALGSIKQDIINLELCE
jgi:hypothetical protein